MSKIVLENFNEGNGYYKVNLAYLNKEQVEEIESLISKWNPTDEDFIDCIGMCLTDVNEQRFKDYGTNLRDCLAWLEKQGNKDKLIKELGEYKVKYTQEVLSQQLEKQREQNPVDKAEQKFKVGDWITDGYLHCKISDVLDDRYIVDTKFAKRSAIHFKCESNYHLWTIQDAKDGDVLLSKYNQPFIYNGIFDEESVGAYCGIDKLGNDFLKDTFSCDWSHKEGVKPTTKEQRELLFQKMKEAGYEWDDEKKELKKIVQKPTWSEEDEHTLETLFIRLDNEQNIYPRLSPDFQEIQAIKEWLNSLKQRIGG